MTTPGMPAPRRLAWRRRRGVTWPGADVDADLVARLGAGIAPPRLLSFAEGEYLKGLLLRMH